MQEPLRQVPVVRQHEEAFALAIEATDREDAGPVFGQERADVGPPLGILHRRYHPGGLVERVVPRAGVEVDGDPL